MFSLSASGGCEALCFFIDPKPLNSGTAVGSAGALSKLMLGLEVKEGLFAGATGFFDSNVGVIGCSSLLVLFSDAANTEAAEPGNARGFGFAVGDGLSGVPSSCVIGL